MNMRSFAPALDTQPKIPRSHITLAYSSGLAVGYLYANLGQVHADSTTDLQPAAIANDPEKPEINISLPPYSTPKRRATDNQITREEARSFVEKQVELIMSARDFRGTLDSLLKYEMFTLFDLQYVLGATRPTFCQWRKAPVQRLRKENATRLRRLITAWKQWVFLGDGAPLGPWVHLTTPCGSLASAVRSSESADSAIDEVIEQLLPIVKGSSETQLHYRRYVAGLPNTFVDPDRRTEAFI